MLFLNVLFVLSGWGGAWCYGLRDSGSLHRALNESDVESLHQLPPPAPWSGKCVEGKNRKLMTLHIQDVSEMVEPSLMTMLATQVLPDYAVNTDFSFTTYNAMSVAKFSNKRQYTRSTWDTCWAVLEGMGEPTLDCQDAYRKLVSNFVEHLFLNPSLGGAPSYDRGAQYDALYAAAKDKDWRGASSKADSSAKRVVFMYTHRLPQLPEDGLYNHQRLVRKLTYDDPALCDEWDTVPTAEEIVQALAAHNINVVFMLKQQHIPVYKSLFKSALETVVGAPHMYFYPLTTDHGNTLKYMMHAIDLIACNDPPSYDDISDPVVVPDVNIGASCGSKVRLQLLHLQDISHSYSNDMDNLRKTYKDLIGMLREDFDKIEFGLGNFRDKNVELLGDAYDSASSCFTESVPFSEDSTLFESTLTAYKPDGGGDWQESQYDALMHGAASDTIGWTRTALDRQGRLLVRIALMATDSGPHVQGDRAGAPPAATGRSCGDTDYPSPAMVGDQLQAWDVNPLFVVTSDIYGYWLAHVEEMLPSEEKHGVEARVVQLAGGSTEVFKAIKSAVDSLCGHAVMRRL